MRQTSLLAYHSLDKDRVSKCQRRVLDALRQIQPATNRMVSEHSGVPINVVTPRMGELYRKSLVSEERRDYDRGRKAIFWKAKD